MTRDKAIAVVLIGIGTLTVACGLLLGGNPVTARRERRDQERSTRLVQINSALQGAFSLQAKLPTSTEAYVQIVTDAGISTDSGPISEIPSYKLLTDETYELCAEFEGASHASLTTRPRTSSIPEESPDFWSHGTGRTCYKLQIPSWVKTEATTRKAATASSTPPIATPSINP